MSEKKYTTSACRAFAVNLKQLRKAADLTQEELGRALNVKKSCISNYEQGFSMPDIHRLLEIANFFKVENLSKLLGYIPQNVACDSEDSTKFVPIVNSVSFGVDPVVPGNIIDEMTLPSINLKSGNFFGYVIPDNSMARSKLKKGDIAIIRKQPLVSTGDIALVVLENGKVYLRKIYLIGNDIISLQPDSDDSGYLPVNLTFGADNFEIIGRVSFIHLSC